MSIFAVLYMMSSATALLAGLPQIRQLLIVKRSDELSLSTWMTWVLTQSVSLLYVISIGEPVMMVANTLWVMYYITCVSLIFYYRRYPGSVLEPVALVDK